MFYCQSPAMHPYITSQKKPVLPRTCVSVCYQIKMHTIRVKLTYHYLYKHIDNQWRISFRKESTKATFQPIFSTLTDGISKAKQLQY